MQTHDPSRMSIRTKSLFSLSLSSAVLEINLSICHQVQKDSARSEKMAQLVKCLQHVHEDLSLIPRTHVKNQEWWHMPVPQYWGGRDERISGADWPNCWISDPLRDAVPNNKVERDGRGYLNMDHWPPWAHRCLPCAIHRKNSTNTPDSFLLSSASSHPLPIWLKESTIVSALALNTHCYSDSASGGMSSSVINPSLLPK